METKGSRYLFASMNSGKLVEVREVAARFGLTVLSPRELKAAEAPPDVEESADTYRGNALLKAEAYARWSGMPAFADDAGLEVEALQGAPGVWSARYAGEAADPEKNIQKLLKNLAGVSNRTAAFRSLICLFSEAEGVKVAEGFLHGRIAEEPAGKGGFGYDSVFIVDGYTETLAELKERNVPVKTHRILALEKLFSELTLG